MSLLIAIFAMLQYRLWFKAGGVHELLSLRHVLATQSTTLAHLKDQNDALLVQIKSLKESKDEAEAHARSELSMIKKDETFYRIVNE
ncbi:MAG: hypothetical protein A3F43_04775 [Gammaproteobacteria bacterium RIFCSPHIGHO2_12_FULL_42_10]|nr:MAG: hypothetical protein A3F43_04775 [Gammaproteobacteria bacterium RIFCSPHIGHO2_12_FULL_42_10]